MTVPVTLTATWMVFASPLDVVCRFFHHPRMSKTTVLLLYVLQSLVVTFWMGARHKRSSYLFQAKVYILLAWACMTLRCFTAVDFHWVTRLLLWHNADVMLIWSKYCQQWLIRKRLHALHNATGCHMNTFCFAVILQLMMVVCVTATVMLGISDSIFFWTYNYGDGESDSCYPSEESHKNFCVIFGIAPVVTVGATVMDLCFLLLANVVLVQPVYHLMQCGLSEGSCGVSTKELQWARTTTCTHFVPTLMSVFSTIAVMLAMLRRAMPQVGCKESSSHESTMVERMWAMAAPVDLTASAVCVVALSGVLGSVPRSSATDAAPQQHQHPLRAATRREPWTGVVCELAHRGFTLEALLNFYLELGRDLMEWFDPEQSTTGDVVRGAIIPASSLSPDRNVSLAEVMMDGVPTLPERMVTHNWSNLFCHLVAAIIADALEIRSYEQIVHLLQTEPRELFKELRLRNVLGITYWVCAFSVNQHRGICGKSFERDKVSRQKHAVCKCTTPKYFEGPSCEMNKFDHMMGFIAHHQRGFRQVVAVDAKFELFWRAWCVAELVKGKELRIMQCMKLHSNEKLAKHWSKLENVKVQKCSASRPEDKQHILSMIPSFTAFNKDLRQLILGNIQGWVDATEQADHLGRIVRAVSEKRRTQRECRRSTG